MKQAIFDAKTRLFMRSQRDAFREMVAAERAPSAEADRRTAERSASIASHAFRSSEFYREFYTAAGFSKRDVAQSKNFALLPLLTKDAIRDAGDALIASGLSANRRLPSRTGGSTGMPLLVYNDASAPTAAYWWRIYSWWGIRPADNTAYIYRQARHGLRQFVYDAQWWPTRHMLLDARSITTDGMEQFEREWRRVRPALLVGYVQGVFTFAEWLRATDRTVPSPRAVSLTASVLQAGQRRLIEDVIGAPVYDTYRSAEIPWIAAECEARSGLHVLADQRRVEIVGDTGVGDVDGGQLGSIVVTDFTNRVYPLVRYSIGDQSRYIQGACVCGRTLDRIDAIRGRVADRVRTPSGLTISGGLSVLFNGSPGIVSQFQIHQASDFSVTIRYVTEKDDTAHVAADEAVRLLGRLLKGEVPVRAERVGDVRSFAGKARLVISDLPGGEVSSSHTP